MVLVIALVVVGRETFRSAGVARPAVFDLTEAVQFVSDGLSNGAAARLTPADVKWVLQVDLDQIEHATAHADDLALGREVLDEREAMVAVLAEADASARGLSDVDVAEILAGRTRYLEAIGAIGPRADEDDAE